MTDSFGMWLLWGTLLVAQNASFTLVSRARNSASLTYHALASVGSNGIWFASQLILFDQFMNIFWKGDWAQAAAVGAFYTACTILGSVGMHALALKKIETGKLKVGASA